MSVRGLNKMMVMGRLGTDPEINPKAKTTVGALSIAAPGKMNGSDQEVQWIKVTVFGKTAELCNQYLKKGSFCLVEGRFQSDKYTGKDGVERWSSKCIADRVVFVPNGEGKGKELSGGSKQDSYDFADESYSPF